MIDSTKTESSGEWTTDISKLLEGYRLFERSEYGPQSTRMQVLAKGQSPKVAVIGCSDSRVDPAIVFNANPGDIFVLRSIANLVPPHDPADQTSVHTASFIEFSVTHLEVSDVVILGHSKCAGIRAVLNAVESDQWTAMATVNDWCKTALDPCKKAVEIVESSTNDDFSVDTLAEQQSILNSLENLRRYPGVESAINAGALNLHGWWFDLSTGELMTATTADPEFRLVDG